MNGPAAADLGTVDVGAAGAPVTVTFSSDGPAPATTGALSLGGADARRRRASSPTACSARTLAAYSECAVSVRLAPAHAGAQSATLSLASNDPASPATVALTGTGRPALPAQRRHRRRRRRRPARRRVFDPAQRAAGLLGTAKPVRGRRGGQPAAVHEDQVGQARQAQGDDAPRGGGVRRRPVLGQGDGEAHADAAQGPQALLHLHPRQVAQARRPAARSQLTLKLSRTDRKRIDAARKAALTLTVTNGTKRVSRAFTLTT